MNVTPLIEPAIAQRADSPAVRALWDAVDAEELEHEGGASKYDLPGGLKLSVLHGILAQIVLVDRFPLSPHHRSTGRYPEPLPHALTWDEPWEVAMARLGPLETRRGGPESRLGAFSLHDHGHYRVRLGVVEGRLVTVTLSASSQ